MDFKQIQELIKLVSKSELTELRVEQENFKITLKKSNGYFSPAPSARPANYEPAPQLQESAAAPAVSGGAKPAAEETTGGTEKYHTIKSPMVGTFYRSPSPDKDPFVKVGDIIKKGEHLCIIEAMKLFNEIESEVDGKVVKVLVEDSSPVEYDQPLFLIDPTGV